MTGEESRMKLINLKRKELAKIECDLLRIGHNGPHPVRVSYSIARREVEKLEKEEEERIHSIKLAELEKSKVTTFCMMCLEKCIPVLQCDICENETCYKKGCKEELWTLADDRSCCEGCWNIVTTDKDWGDEEYEDV